MELAAEAGLDMDAWQRFVLVNSLGERPDGRWLTPDIGLLVSRQNGKGVVLEARELAGLFLFGERLLIHSAHLFDTSMEHFERMLALLEDRPDFDRQIEAVSRSHGSEGIKLKSGQRLRFKTRTKGGGRGFSCDCLVLDEAMELPEATYAALRPTLSARPNPQVWHVGSAVNQEIHENGLVLARIRKRGYDRDPSLAFFEWAAGERMDSSDPGTWAVANPALGIRIPFEAVAAERASMSAKTFAVERLGIGDWPDLDAGNSDLDFGRWPELTDATARMDVLRAFALDTGPDRAWTSIGAAGDGGSRLLLELVDRRRGTGWVVERCVELNRAHGPVRFIVDSGGPAASLIPSLEAAGLSVISASTSDVATAAANLVDGVREGRFVHGPQQDLADSIANARKRSLGDGRFAIGRKASGGDVTALIAVSLAAWAASSLVIDVSESVW